MTRYWTLFSSVVALLLACYGLTVWLGVDLGEMWRDIAQLSPWYTAGVGSALLILDVFLPVPSMLVILGLGDIFGTVLGGLISLVSTTLASLTAFGIGRLARHRLERWVGLEEQEQADRMLSKWGITALIVTRPMPLISETTALMAGASEMTWSRATIGCVIGSVPMSFLYAATGAGLGAYDDIALVFITVMLLALGAWLMGRRLEEKVGD